MPRHRKSNEASEIFTVGHSTHPLERFLELLDAHRIAALADVRSFPSSRRWPQFNQPALCESMARAGVEYHWIPKLGGRRHGVQADSPHVAWRHPAFRSYADYADGGDFRDGLKELTALARGARCAFMCSEGLWWRCHRRIISDHLTLLGWRVTHILPNGKLSEHALPDFATVVDGGLLYNKSGTCADEGRSNRG
jgi:uncharacterized protein (DUF488 family)